MERELEATDSQAAVYLATHVVLPRRVALKVMHLGAHYERTVAMQLLRETCLLEAIAHPAVPRVYECGVLPDKRPWSACEHVDAPSLAELLATSTLPIADLVVVLRDTADLLQHAHARGVVHRKLAPAAILSTPGRLHTAVVIRNWDAAQAVDRTTPPSSGASVRGQAGFDAADDIYALAAIAFRALTGEPYNCRASAAQRCPAAPDELTALVDRMLAPAPTDRPGATEVRDRASWLASTVSSLVTTTRWTPPRGLNPDSIPAVEDLDAGFVVRISRSPTR